MIKLVNPIKVDGKEVKELPFDTSLFGIDEMERANLMVVKKNKGVITAQETDFNYHFIVASIVVEKSSESKITCEDLRRLKGTDLFNLQSKGRDFLLESAIHEQGILEGESEDTDESSK